MIKYLEATGKTIDLAVQNALDQLGLERDDVSLEILEQPKTGFLGIGSCPAKIRVSYEAPDEEVTESPAEEAEEIPAPAESCPCCAEEEIVPPAPAREPAASTQETSAAPAVPAAKSDAEEAISGFLNGLMEQLDIDAKAEISLSERGAYEVVLVGEGLGRIIGRRGETLDAIQQLTSYAVNRGRSQRVRIHLDAEGYRAKREEALANMARRTAEKAIRQQRSITLEPMNAYERHVVHAALQDYPHVSTHSVGVEPHRRTVIAYDEGEE